MIGAKCSRAADGEESFAALCSGRSSALAISASSFVWLQSLFPLPPHSLTLRFLWERPTVSNFCTVSLTESKIRLEGRRSRVCPPWKTLPWFLSPLAHLKFCSSLPVKATGGAVGEIYVFARRLCWLLTSAERSSPSLQPHFCHCLDRQGWGVGREGGVSPCSPGKAAHCSSCFPPCSGERLHLPWVLSDQRCSRAAQKMDLEPVETTHRFVQINRNFWENSPASFPPECSSPRAELEL